MSLALRYTAAMVRALLIVATLLLALPVLAQSAEPRPRDGEWIEFHGWRPDSGGYAYTLVRLRTRGEKTRRVEKLRVVRVDERGRAHRREPSEPPRGALEGLVARPARSERPDESTVRFFLNDGRELTFRLVLGERLGYAVSLKTGERAVGVGMGRFDDLYPRFEAYAFPSPDGRSVAFVIYGESPYRIRGEVHFMRLPAESPADGF